MAIKKNNPRNNRTIQEIRSLFIIYSKRQNRRQGQQ